MLIRIQINRSTVLRSLVVCFVLVAFSVGLFWGDDVRSWVFGKKDNLIVEMTSDGFVPESVSVNVGSSVTFVNKDSKSRWPASDLHPTHEIYSEFDPKNPIEPGDSWTFTFTKEGEWSYHDHLIPHQKGVVTVGTAAKTSSLPEEIANLKNLSDPKQQATIVRLAAEKYGPEQTLAFMKQSGLPYTGETHLLVHEIGNVAYKKYQMDALKACDDSFLSACYHGVVLNALGDHGMDGVSQLVERCKSAGVHVVGQCSHAAGHGFLAWSDYKVLEALPMCDTLVENNANVPAFNCYDGVFMENIFGVHDGKPSPNRMVKQSDLLYPCNAVAEKYQGGCWANQATLIFQQSGGNYEKVAQVCDGLTDKEHQRICYHNFARQIHPSTFGKTDMALELCSYATGQDWKDQCLITLVEAAFSVGDREKMPYELCPHVVGQEKKDRCYQTLYQQIQYYAGSPEVERKWCGLLAEAGRTQVCLSHR